MHIPFFGKRKDRIDTVEDLQKAVDEINAKRRREDPKAPEIKILGVLPKLPEEEMRKLRGEDGNNRD